MNNLIIFDLDGVITSEEAYWDAAGLTLHELLYSPRYWDIEGNRPGGQEKQHHPAATAEESRRISRAVLPEAEILALKARAINSNWDTCYAAVCLRLINLLALLPDISALLPLRPWAAEWLASFRKLLQNVGAPLVGAQGRARMNARSGAPWDVRLNAPPFDPPVFNGYIRLGLISRLDVY